jgi:hypothetical protein
MGNIFTTENIAKYNTKGRTVGVGEYVLRNGVWLWIFDPNLSIRISVLIAIY